MKDNITFKIVCKINHKGNNYLILMGNNLLKYFVKEVKNGYEYVTFEEYQELVSIYGTYHEVGKYDIKNFKPYIIFKNRIVPIGMVLAMSASLFSCTNSKADSVLKKYNELGVCLEDGVIENDGIYHLTAYSGGLHPYEKVTYANEFGSITGYAHKTYSDVKNAINSNSQINEEYKEFLIEGLKNLEKNNYHGNLDVLYFNICKFKGFKYENIQDEDNVLTIAKFDPYTQTITIGNVESSNLKNTIIHEFLGHGMQYAYDEDSKTLCTPDYGYYSISPEGTVIGSGSIGTSLSEGAAEKIKSLATNTALNDETTPYLIEAYSLELLCSVAGITIEDYMDNGVEYLFVTLRDAGIKMPEELIGYLDTVRIALNRNELSGINANIDEVLFEGLLKDLIERLQKEGLSDSNIVDYINDIINKTSSSVIPNEVDGRQIYADTTIDGIAVIDLTNLKSKYLAYIKKNNNIPTR